MASQIWSTQSIRRPMFLRPVPGPWIRPRTWQAVALLPGAAGGDGPARGAHAGAPGRAASPREPRAGEGWIGGQSGHPICLLVV